MAELTLLLTAALAAVAGYLLGRRRSLPEPTPPRPVENTPPRPDEAPPAPAPEDAPAVLVIDDEPELLRLIGNALAGLCRVETARSGAEGLRRAREGRFDLVLSDVSLPDVSGLEVCRALGPSLPVILVSGHTDTESVVRGWEAGAADYVFKPFHRRELAARVRAMLNQLAARRQAERALAKRGAELERSNRELEEFASVAAHDLQSPLRKISGFADLLAERVEAGLDEESRTMLRLIIKSTGRMQVLVDTLLEYSRIGRELSTRSAPVPLGAAVEEALENLQAELEASGARVSCAPLPTVLGDRRRLVQLLQNLLSNALKFRRPGAAPKVTVSAERQGPRWLLRVADDGIGIPADKREKVFRLFSRLHPDSEYPGLGLGLALGRRIVEQHGGSVWVEPSPGGGATVCFTLPAADGA